MEQIPRPEMQQHEKIAEAKGRLEAATIKVEYWENLARPWNGEPGEQLLENLEDALEERDLWAGILSRLSPPK